MVTYYHDHQYSFTTPFQLEVMVLLEPHHNYNRCGYVVRVTDIVSQPPPPKVTGNGVVTTTVTSLVVLVTITT